MKRLTCYFGGNVQGVGFRYTAMNIAQEYDVVGFVRNTSDGRVELVAEGPPKEVDSLLDEIKHRMWDFIGDVEVNTSPATGEFKRFGIMQ